MSTYTNPIYDAYMADPFVLCHDNSYYAYGTGPRSPEGAQFPLLVSPDLVHWQRYGWALVDAVGDDFWAPEVAYHEGVFYLYYSASGIGGQDHQLRVATSLSPLGPFKDAGRVLVPDQPFTIDAHPFQDDDGTWYLFYSRDFLTLDDDHRVGTGISVDRLVDMVTPADNPQIVVRPHQDWHLFKAQREMYGAVYDWHTVEGPAVRKHNGLYYCFYSGGAWEKDNYGVHYVVADHPLGPYRRPETEPILKSVPGKIIGPGHNSFTRSLSGKEEFIVYHAWDVAMTGRYMCIDRFVWEGDHPAVIGPTNTPQPIPE